MPTKWEQIPEEHKKALNEAIDRLSLDLADMYAKCITSPGRHQTHRQMIIETVVEIAYGLGGNDDDDGDSSTTAMRNARYQQPYLAWLANGLMEDFSYAYDQLKEGKMAPMAIGLAIQERINYTIQRAYELDRRGGEEQHSE